MTLREAAELIRNLELVYPVARLVDAENTTVWTVGEAGTLQPAGCCFAVWGKDCRCENCTSLCALQGRETLDKIEYIDADAFHVTSKYIEIDGCAYVLEVVSKLAEDPTAPKLKALPEEPPKSRYETIQEAMEIVKDVVPGGFWQEEISEEGHIGNFRFSEEFRAMLGYKKERLPDSLEALLKITHPDDIERMKKTARDVIAGIEDSFSTEYRLKNAAGRYMWVKGKGKVLRNKEGKVTDIFGEVREVSDRRLREQDTLIIDVLTSEYSGVYLVDLKAGTAVPYSMQDSTANEIEKVFAKDQRYYDMFRACVEMLVYRDDKQRMLEAGTVGNIMKELRNKKTFRTVYRDTKGRYCEMKFIKMGNEQGVPEMAALCFSDNDEGLRPTIESTERLERNLDIISLFTSEYISVHYINLETGAYDSYSAKANTDSKFKSGKDFTAAYKSYVTAHVHPEDREMMLRAGSVFRILEELRNRKTYVTLYRNELGRYCVMKFVKIGEGEYPKAVALGFRDRDEETLEERRSEAFRRVYLDLTADFVCVAFIDLKADPEQNVKLYRGSDLLEHILPGLAKVPCYEKVRRLIAERFVVPEEREDIVRLTELKNVLRALSEHSAYLVPFNAWDNGKKARYVFKFTADIDENGDTTGIVAGFSEDLHGENV